LRLLARSALAATAGVAAGLAFEPYHWWFLLPIAKGPSTTSGVDTSNILETVNGHSQCQHAVSAKLHVPVIKSARLPATIRNRVA